MFLPNICVLHVAVFGVSSYYMEKFNPGGGWCSVFVEKTNKEKKTRKRANIFIKSIDTDEGRYYYTITDTKTCQNNKQARRAHNIGGIYYVIRLQQSN